MKNYEKTRVIIHKVVSSRTVQKGGLEELKRKIAQNPTMDMNYADILFHPFFKPFYFLEEHEDMAPILKGLIMSLSYGTFPVILAVMLAYFPIGVLQKMICEAQKQDIDLLKQLGVYDIVMERIGAKGFENPEQMEQLLWKDIEEKGFQKCKKRK